MNQLTRKEKIELLKKQIEKRSGEQITLDTALAVLELSEDNEQSQKNNAKTAIEYEKSRDDSYMFMLESFGEFYFNFYDKFSKIDNNFMFRFLYICTYSNYELKLSTREVGGKLIGEKELQVLLRLSTREYQKTKAYLVQNKLIEINSDKSISVNKEYCRRGKIPAQNKQNKVKVFDNGIRELYENSNPREHKKMALLFRLLPYINFRWNSICSNPEECEMENVNPLTMKDICLIAGYYETHSTRLKNELYKIKVNGEYTFCSFRISDKEMFFINPRIYYKGKNKEELRTLSELFKCVK